MADSNQTQLENSKLEAKPISLVNSEFNFTIPNEQGFNPQASLISLKVLPDTSVQNYKKLSVPAANATAANTEPRAAATIDPAVGNFNFETGTTRATVGAHGNPYAKVELAPGGMYSTYGTYGDLMQRAGMDSTKVYTSDGTATLLGGLSVTIADNKSPDGKAVAAGLYSVSANQINFVVPTNLDTVIPDMLKRFEFRPTASIEITYRRTGYDYNSRTDSANAFPIRTAVYLTDQNSYNGADLFVQTDPAKGGTPFPNGIALSQVLALHQDGKTIVSPTDPLKPGDNFSVFMTGDSRLINQLSPSGSGIDIRNDLYTTKFPDGTVYSTAGEKTDAVVKRITTVSPGLFKLDIALSNKQLLETTDPRDKSKTGIVMSIGAHLLGGSGLSLDSVFVPFQNK